MLPTELLDGGQRDQVHQRLEKFIRSHIEELLGPLLACEALEASGSARGIAFQVFEGLGSQPRFKVEELIRNLESDDRRALHRVGVRLGPLHVFQPKMGKTHQVNLRALLWSLHQGRNLPAPVPANGRTSIKPTEGVPHLFYNMIGYPVVGPLAIRMEILDRVISKLHDSAEGNIAVMDNSWAELLGCGLDDLKAVLTALGYQELPPEEGETPADAATDTATETTPEVAPAETVEAVATETAAEPVTDEASVETTEETAEAAKPAAPVRFRLTKPRLGGQPRREPKRGDGPRKGKSQPANDGVKGKPKSGGPRRDKGGKRGKPQGKTNQFKGDSQPMTYSPFEKLRALQQASDGDKAE